MKITVDVELSEGEAGLSAQIVRLLQGVSDNVTTSIHTDKQALSRLIQDAVTGNTFDIAAHEIARRLSKPELALDCVQVLCDLCFDSARVEKGEPVTPYVQLMLWQAEPIRGKLREEVLGKVLSFLSQPRRLDCSRDPLLPYGETFAALVKLDAVGVKGALTALIQLIRNDATRAAGLTALGKLVEVAADVINDRCDLNLLEQLRSTLAAAQDEIFLYDIEYISEPFGWSQNSATKGTQSLSWQKSCRHHTKSVLSLSYSPQRDIVVSASADGSIGTWDCTPPNITLIETCTLARHFACCVDVSSRGNLLLVSGAAQSSETSPAVIFYSTDEANHWLERGGVQPEHTTVISSAKIMGVTSNGFFFSTSLYSPERSIVAYYDGTRMVGLREYREHADIATCLYTPADRDNLIVSGSRDCTLMVFDVRSGAHGASQSVQLFGTVSCVNGIGDYIVCGGLDKRLWVYDVRMMGQAMTHRDFESAILDCAVSPNSMCAVSTLTSLSVVNLSGASTPNKADCGGAPSTRYHGVRWHSSGLSVVAGSDASTVDLYGFAM